MCILTMRMSEMTLNIENVLLVSFQAKGKEKSKLKSKGKKCLKKFDLVLEIAKFKIGNSERWKIGSKSKGNIFQFETAGRFKIARV